MATTVAIPQKQSAAWCMVRDLSDKLEKTEQENKRLQQSRYIERALKEVQSMLCEAFIAPCDLEQQYKELVDLSTCYRYWADQAWNMQGRHIPDYLIETARKIHEGYVKCCRCNKVDIGVPIRELLKSPGVRERVSKGAKVRVRLAELSAEKKTVYA